MKEETLVFDKGVRKTENSGIEKISRMDRDRRRVLQPSGNANSQKILEFGGKVPYLETMF